VAGQSFAVFKVKNTSQVLVAHICYPKLHRRLRLGQLQFQARLSKKFARPISMEKSWE
jgi:hypothetical protein